MYNFPYTFMGFEGFTAVLMGLRTLGQKNALLGNLWNPSRSPGPTYDCRASRARRRNNK
jgi:hypothetical protein